ncbi:MAG TPA: DUF4416 family protein [Bacteroidetes bacterium]|uniref:DUF4416 domain-containing protein n=1 Tax=candidate division TA06 bacterium TaxID=2250710 RepID=A0A660S9R8_UNCT6|nr:MAG: DUF4416 domain-containing protein [candidate division TA06 bacterium]HHD82527.1 DUF4416 family protein [Bacteroidota bacterium]
MKKPQAALIIGVLLAKANWPEIESILTGKFGKIALKTEPIDFIFTNYYNDEMGDDIKRFWIAFEKKIFEDELADIKNYTIFLETKYGRSGKRTINLDPGYLNLSRLILASTKDFSHRIYLKDGIYGEVTLIYKNKGFTSLPWTYPDYKIPLLQEFLKKIRKSILL